MTSEPPSAQDHPPDCDRAAINVLHTLHPTRCAECGYTLRGLPQSGVCPECGQAYSIDDVVLFGWGVADHGNPQNVRRGRALFGIVGMLASWLPTLFLLVWFKKSFLVIPIFCFGLFVTWIVVRRQRQIEQFGAPARIHLSASGYCQIDNVPMRRSHRRPHGWTSKTDIDIVRQHANCYRITIYNRPFRWWWIMHSAVAIEVDMDDATASLLTTRVLGWIEAQGH
ncbi:hypothetical protein BH09PLA1_BH09PLA1_33700 [soil metagenome]